MKKYILVLVFLGLLSLRCTLTPLVSTQDSTIVITHEDNTHLVEDLVEYFKNQKAELKLAPIDNGWFLSCFSRWRGKGNVTTEEIKLFRSLEIQDCEAIAQILDWKAVKKFASDFVSRNDSIKKENVWHDALYEEISAYNAQKLGYQDKNRNAVLAAMLKQKETRAIKEAFIFGIAVTLEIEKQMALKK